jgi:hypothetical protein
MVAFVMGKDGKGGAQQHENQREGCKRWGRKKQTAKIA